MVRRAEDEVISCLEASLVSSLGPGSWISKVVSVHLSCSTGVCASIDVAGKEKQRERDRERVCVMDRQPGQRPDMTRAHPAHHLPRAPPRAASTHVAGPRALSVFALFPTSLYLVDGVSNGPNLPRPITRRPGLSICPRRHAACKGRLGHRWGTWASPPGSGSCTSRRLGVTGARLLASSFPFLLGQLVRPTVAQGCRLATWRTSRDMLLMAAAGGRGRPRVEGRLRGHMPAVAHGVDAEAG